MELRMQDPATESKGAVLLRLRGPLFEQLENWRREQRKIPSRSEAVRLLIEGSLMSGVPARIVGD
jgi:hypothetical protein